MSTKTRTNILIVASALSVINSGDAATQEALSLLPGVKLTLDVAHGVTVSDNYSNVADPAGASGILTTDLTFGLESKTRTQTIKLAFGGQTVLGHLADDDGDTFGFQNPFGTLDYTQNGASTTLAVQAGYKQLDVNDTDIADTFTNTDLIYDNGTLEQITANLQMEFGTRSPIGAAFSLGYSDSTYQDTTDPDLIDTFNFSVDAYLRVDLSRTAELKLIARFSETDEDDLLDSKQSTRNIGLGLTYTINPTLVFGSDLTFDRRERRTTVLGVESAEIDEGVSAALSLTRQLPNGSLGAIFNSAVITGGRSASLTVDRKMDLKRGSVTYSFGAKQTNSNGFDPLLSVFYQGELPRASYTVKLSQDANTDLDGDQFLNSNISLGYAYDLNSISSLTLDLSHRASDAQALLGIDRAQSNFSVGYTRALTKDWDLRASYKHRLVDDDGSAAVRSNTIAATISRSYLSRR
jgi:hypothetical protein